jgi:outer membrane immunogenic protein
MKKVLLGAVGLLAACASSPTFAADMAVKAAPVAPLPMVYNWTGFYIGANGGWGQSHNCLDFITAVGTVASGCGDRSGGLAGGQIGYRWQANQFVFGLEAQGDWADLSNTRVSLLDPALSTTVKTDGIGLFTAQLGWAWNASLFYVKGGAAVTSNRLDIFDNIAGINVFSASNTRWGGALGVGWEYGFAPNWSIGIEYDHLWMGNADNTFNTTNARFVRLGLLSDRISQDVDMVTLRLNYRFGGYGLGKAPVAARY